MSTKDSKPMADSHHQEPPVIVPSAQGVELHPTPDQFDSSTDRRTFLTLMGASLGMAGLAGCVRKPMETIMPFTRRPEDLVPGNPVYYATAAWVGGSVLGLLVESQEGRPTKIEGNPRHPMANPLAGGRLGRSNAWAQASILDLYDPDRTDRPHHQGQPSDWKSFWAFLQRHFTALRGEGGAGLAVLTDGAPSPTLRRQLAELLSGPLPQGKLYVEDPAWNVAEQEGLGLLGLPAGQLVYRLEKAQVILAVDADPIGLEGDAVRNAQQFASARVREPRGDRRRAAMSRLYAVEPHFTVTGQMADNRLRASGPLAGRFLLAVAARLQQDGMPLGLEGLGATRITEFTAAMAEESGRPAGRFETWVAEVSRELRENAGRAVVCVGPRQPAWAHALAYVLNHALGAVGPGRPVALVPDPERPKASTLATLAAEIRAGRVKTLLMLGTNPAYAAPGDLDLPRLLGQVPTTIHLSTHLDETSRRATWHVPITHALEAWGDLRASDGTVSICQPLIAPLRGAVSPVTLLARLGGGEATDHDAVRATWRARTQGPGFEDRFRRWLNDGVADLSLPAPVTAAPQGSALSTALRALPAPATPQGLQLCFALSSTLYDGRYANNAWLQELPDTVSKLTWDNAAWIGPREARRQGLRSGDLVRISQGRQHLEIAAWIVPGVADRTVVLPLGYGRSAGGRVADRGRGFDAYALRAAASPHYQDGATLAPAGRRYPLASTQQHGSMREPFTHKIRPVVREHTLAEYQSSRFPGIWSRYDLIAPNRNRSLWKSPLPKGGHQWAMVIDLARCLGCNACTVACQAENGIPVVGKEEVMNGRVLHWIRVDRYFTSADDRDPVTDPDAGLVTQPLPCQQCETAPCENVCPVGATQHSPEGLNDMAYNRCIGTRYCANNCPFKVRRFNFHNYAQAIEKLVPLISMQRNPDVSVRFRGVMEKCTYCVQRIQEAKIAAKTDAASSGVIPEGAVVPACVQACPGDAIVFGNLNDPKSRVARWRRSARGYAVLSDLNLHPRTTYLAKLRNPNTKLA